MQPPKEIVKYDHIRQVSLNTGLTDMKCTVKGDKNYGRIKQVSIQVSWYEMHCEEK